MEPDLTFSVPEVAALAADAVSAAFPDLIWVEGEVCNLNRSARGHVYFSLVEPGSDRRSPDSQLAVTLFEWNRQKVNLQIKRSGGNIRVEDGVKVRIRGSLELYRPRGQLQLKMIAIDPAYTLGSLAAERARLLARLAEEGLLDANAALRMPGLPLRVGLVTSAGSAAHADFLHEISAAAIGFHVLVADARVQGVDAPETIAAAIRATVAAGVEVVCVVRGGGARTDLAAFDHELIARAIAACPVPVWVGVGHEIDRTVADDVAHSSLKTPTACAAQLVATARAGIDAVESSYREIVDGARMRIDAERAALGRAAHAVVVLTRGGIERGRHHAVLAAARVGAAATRHIDDADRHLERASASVRTAAPRRVRSAERELDAMAAQVRALDPARIMERGWSVTRRSDGTLVRSADDLAAGDVIVTRFVDGRATSTVSAVEQP